MKLTSLFACLFFKRGPFLRQLYGPQSYFSASNLRVSVRMRVSTRKLAQINSLIIPFAVKI